MHSQFEVDTIAYLRSPEAIRERCGKLFALAQSDRLRYFRCDLTQMDRVADYVIAVTREHYPDLQIPFHSRWRHFEVGNVPRLGTLDRALSTLSPLEKAKAKFDLVIPSVLLDAGAGDRWHYLEAETGQVWSRSEGLAVASFDLFCRGAFSSNPDNAYQTDAEGLQNLTSALLAVGFQVNSDNPLVGMEGRSQLLQKLGQALQKHPNWFGATNPRPGNLVDYLLQHAQDGNLSAPIVLDAILQGFGEIWSGRVSLAGINLGDVWLHPALPGTEISDKLVPFHKLSQWLTYSLLEPLQELGLTITDLDALTGLPEYRNGGLCLDLGLLQVKDQQILQQSHLPGAEAIVEWRALTVCLLDAISDTIRQRLNLSASDLPLVKVLQGGTWAAGRRIAATRRPGGVSPIRIESDGTVF
ncbi:MAG: URC4/urg3 family protein [Phormidesmis sp. CAN_BIN36]|nr:URC4/urg3 family protein [Phormidesmis sp. CAN_BIN36]